MLYSAFKIFYIIYTIVCLLLSFIAYYFMDQYSPQKIKTTIIVLVVIWFIMLFAIMEIK